MVERVLVAVALFEPPTLFEIKTGGIKLNENETNAAQEILLACSSAIKELEAIADYTQKIISTQSDDMRAIYTDNRQDELPHIQGLVLAITALVNGESPKAAEEVG